MERIIVEQKVYLNPTASIGMVMEQAGYDRRESTQLIRRLASTNTRLDCLNQKRDGGMLPSYIDTGFRKLVVTGGILSPMNFLAKKKCCLLCGLGK